MCGFVVLLFCYIKGVTFGNGPNAMSNLTFHSSFRYKPYKDEAGRKRPPPPPECIYGPIYYVGPLTVCAYLVQTSAGLVLIDSGDRGDGRLILKNVENLGFNIRDLQSILLTHWHWDHSAGANEIVEATGARVMIHEKDSSIVETGAYRGKPLPEEVKIPPTEVSRKLVDGERLEFGDTAFEVIHCPGQSAGEVVYLTTVDGPNGPCRTLFCGDAHGFKHFKRGLGGLEFLGYPGVCGDYRSTVEKLKSLEFDLFLGGHPRMVFNELHEDGNPFLRREEWLRMVSNRHEKMEAFVRENPEYLKW